MEERLMPACLVRHISKIKDNHDGIDGKNAEVKGIHAIEMIVAIHDIADFSFWYVAKLYLEDRLPGTTDYLA
jgi:hypothetical protein